jgi:hypothetical protein
MFTLPALLARERILDAQRVAEQYRLAARVCLGRPLPLAGARGGALGIHTPRPCRGPNPPRRQCVAR